MVNKKLKLKRGFTLVETMVATFVLITAIIGPLSIVAKGVFFSNLAKDQFISFYLSQETIEYLRNKRDVNTMSGGNWSDFKSRISPCFYNYNPNGCFIDVAEDALGSCTTSGCGYLKQNSSSGLFGYGSGGGWSNSPFIRTIRVYNQPPDDTESNEMMIEVTMSWKNGFLNKTSVLRENIFNWQ